jgi:RNA 3'-terminal phosphate cyclase (ATP)
MSNLPRRIGVRELETVRAGLELDRRAGRIDDVRSPGPGNAVWIAARAAALTEVFTAFGQKGVTAEAVAGAAVAELVAWRDRGAPVGEHLADQLLVPLALAGGGAFRTGPPSLHATTNAQLIERFLPVRFRFDPTPGSNVVTVSVSAA